MMENGPEDDVIAKQLEFVEWLKDNGMYNQFDSAHTMRKMMSVWEKMNEKHP